jgi:hypothetical protein
MIPRGSIDATTTDAAEDKNSRRVAETEIFLIGPPLIEIAMIELLTSDETVETLVLDAIRRTGRRFSAGAHLG